MISLHSVNLEIGRSIPILQKRRLRLKTGNSFFSVGKSHVSRAVLSLDVAHCWKVRVFICDFGKLCVSAKK